jgi:2-dehydro-3-deoxy-D-arabinonate dehydratase
MRLYKISSGIIIETEKKMFLLQEIDWNAFVNDDSLFEKIEKLLHTLPQINEPLSAYQILPPMQSQELWACGVTYLRSKIGREEESKVAGGSDFYSRVYDAERPEVFFKSTAHRVVGHGDKVNIRKDSTWDVPEPELTLMVSSSGKIVGYTIGNDMSSRSIEGENPLYLPQAKTYDACAAVGPCIFVTDKPIPLSTGISLEIIRNENTVFKGHIELNQMKRTPEELVSFVYRECSFPYGCLIMTGTGIVPGNDFTLWSGDRVNISIDQIGTLSNTVR